MPSPTVRSPSVLSLMPSPGAEDGRSVGGVQQVLVVDDEEAMCRILARQLGRDGYEVHTASNGVAALEMLQRQKFVAMICDIGLPDVPGSDVLVHALLLEPHLAVVMCTGADDAHTAKTVLSRGAYDYLVKPVELSVVSESLRRALDERRRRIEREVVETRMRDDLAARSLELERERHALKALTIGVAEALVNAMEKKDRFLRGHSQRVAELGAEIARELGLDAETVRAVHLGGRLHDVGKIGIREEVLHKPGRLTEDEYAHVKEHVALGMEILAPLPDLGEALTFVHHHHERMDGTGYPQGLSGEAISLGGRILCAADTFDALTSVRPYRAPMQDLETLAFLEGLSGPFLDPTVYDALTRVVRARRNRLYEELGREWPVDTSPLELAS